MIVTKIAGGLGNQMFQYAMGRSVALRNNTELRLDCSWFASQPPATFRDYSLPVFPAIASISLYEESDGHVLDCCDYIKYIFYRLHKKKFLQRIKEPHFHYWDGIERIHDNCFLEGYWQSYLYSNSFSDVIKKDFVFPQITDEINFFYVRSILGFETPVAVHVRRGDYAYSSKAMQVLGLLGLDYYHSAFNIIEKKTVNPTYVFFSDEPEWIESAFSDRRRLVVSGNTGENAYRDMQLMSLCSHHIIANSSFSWWGAWLSNSGGVAIAPSRWSKDGSIDTSDICPPNWFVI